MSIPEGFAVPYCYSRTIFSWPRLLGKSTKPSGLLPGFKHSLCLVSSSLPLTVAGNGKEEMRWDRTWIWVWFKHYFVIKTELLTAAPLEEMKSFVLGIHDSFHLDITTLFLGWKPWIQVQLAKLEKELQGSSGKELHNFPLMMRNKFLSLQRVRSISTLLNSSVGPNQGMLGCCFHYH